MTIFHGRFFVAAAALLLLVVVVASKVTVQGFVTKTTSHTTKTAASARTWRPLVSSCTLPLTNDRPCVVLHSLGDAGLYNYDTIDATAASSLIIAAQEWRQYVSLAVVAGVLLDIVLGSPIANAALKPLRDAQEELKEDEVTEEQKAAKAQSRSRERIDSDRVAQEAIDRAQNVLELKRYLEERKTDWDRMEDLKRDLDRNMQNLDEDLKARQEVLDRKSNTNNNNNNNNS